MKKSRIPEDIPAWRSDAGRSSNKKTLKNRRSKASPSTKSRSARRSAANSFCTELMKRRSFPVIWKSRGQFYDSRGYCKANYKFFRPKFFGRDKNFQIKCPLGINI
ncbi:MAG: hypothetical protein A3I06_05830 [Candidatus Lindowbacteria bacterium RIFCSPLOWO2_02_FULL_62_12]|nr:MAG: hypothetical protein A3I06_05830 [Candidatus Lindowbacteria bacterium RIFCSPLOWO2_02_FULL_62_12]